MGCVGQVEEQGEEVHLVDSHSPNRQGTVEQGCWDAQDQAQCIENAPLKIKVYKISFNSVQLTCIEVIFHISKEKRRVSSSCFWTFSSMFAAPNSYDAANVCGALCKGWYEYYASSNHLCSSRQPVVVHHNTRPAHIGDPCSNWTLFIPEILARLNLQMSKIKVFALLREKRIIYTPGEQNVQQPFF